MVVMGEASVGVQPSQVLDATGIEAKTFSAQPLEFYLFSLFIHEKN